MLSFKQWFVLDEGSYTEADIPPYFYLACYFSEDLVRKKSYTPDGAACTLVGVEGVSSIPKTMSDFFSSENSVGLQMPGKAFTELNRVSMVGYDNPDYLTSAGFRTPRRIKGGRQSQNSLYIDLTNTFLALIRSSFPTIVANILDKHDVYDLVSTLKKVPGNPWGSRKQEVDVEGPPEKPGEKHTKLVGKNIKPERHRHIENNLKNISNINDLASRLTILFKDIPGIKELLKPASEENGKAISWIEYYLKKAVIDTFSTNKGEKEWVLKRQAIGRMGKKCPHCNAFNVITSDQIGTDVLCVDCHTDFKAYLPLERDIAHKPVVNVPEGSIMYLGSFSPDYLKPWVRKIVQQYEKQNGNVSSKDTMRVLVDKFKLYQHFEVHFVDKAIDTTERLSSLSYDPEKKELQKKMIQAVKRGINRVDTLQKWLERKEGVSPSKFKAFLDRWEKFGVIKVGKQRRKGTEKWEKGWSEDSIITILDSNFDEDKVLILRTVQNSDGISTDDIHDKLNVDPSNTLTTLEKEGKIYQQGDKWYLKYNEEEKSNLSDLDHKILERIKDPNNLHSFVTSFPELGDIEEADIRKATRVLKHKGLIFHGIFSKSMLATDEKTLMGEQTKLLAYLKKYPVSNLFTMSELKNVHNWRKALDYLHRRGLVTSNGEDILLADKTSAHPNASKYPKGYQEIIDVVNNHYVCNIDEISKILKKDYYAISSHLNSLQNNDIIKYNSSSERWVSAESKPGEETVEFRKILELLEKDSYTSNQLSHEIPSKSNGAAKTILDILEKQGKVKKTYDAITNTNFWHLAHKTHETNYKPYMDAILEVFKKKDKPLSLDKLRQSYSTISHKGMKTILEKMVELKLLEQGVNFSEERVWMLPGGTRPLSKEIAYKMIVDYIAENGPISSYKIKTHFTTELDVSSYVIDNIIIQLGDKGTIESNYDDFESDYLLSLPGQVDSTKQELKEKLIKVVAEHPGDLYDIKQSYNATNEPLNDSKIGSLLTMCVANKTLTQSLNLNGDWFYHIPEYNYVKTIEDKITTELTKKGGQALLSDLANLGSTSYIKQYVSEMETAKKLHTTPTIPKELILSYSSNATSLLISLTPIPDGPPLLVQRVMAFLESQPEHQATAMQVLNHLNNNQGLVKDLIRTMIKHGMIHFVEMNLAMPSSTFMWNDTLKKGTQPLKSGNVNHSHDDIQGNLNL